jgi:O-acetyl-ADP-ribose deacetylase (regulator of RNase III)
MPSFIPGGPRGPIVPPTAYKKIRDKGEPVEQIAKLHNALSVGSVTVAIYRGNIADAAVGIIVNPTNSDCILIPQGVTKALIETEGPTLPLFAQQGGPLIYGEVKLTKVSHLNAEYVMHLAIDRNPSEAAGSYSGLTAENKADILRTCTLGALAKAEEMAAELKKKSIAFPCLKTAVVDLPEKEVARVMLEVIAEKARSTPLEKIDMVLESDAAYYAFNREINRLQARISNAGFFPSK